MAGRPEPRTTSRFDTRVDYMFSSEVKNTLKPIESQTDISFCRHSIRTGAWKTMVTFHTMPQTTALLSLISVDSEKIYTCVTTIPFSFFVKKIVKFISTDKKVYVYMKLDK